MMQILPPLPVREPQRGRWKAWLTVLLVGTACLSGCMYRRLTIRSDPPGALVIVDGQEVGFTPYSTDFIYYGTREITLVKDGYETLTVLQPGTRR